ncbi:MAG: hypothetical protein WC624_06990, partial [Candidatus Margulisiibacteriota bacterium]
DEMFEFAVRRLMPIDVSDVYNWDKIIKTFGQREAAEAQIGEYEAEFAISRKLFDLGNLNDTTFDNMLMTLTGGYSPKERAERLTMALKSCGGAYLFEIEGGRSHFGRELARNVREFAVERKWGIFKTSILDVMKAILKNNRIGLDKEKAAVLALMVASGKLTKERAIRFVSREPESEIADQGSLIIKYASSEENRIFTLRKVINILIGMAS